MAFIIIGSIVGLIMGLTGAGGAMISIPLFTTLMTLPLKEATVLSLVAVLIGTTPNLLTRMDKVNWHLAFIISLTGIIASFLTTPIKEKTSEMVIAALLVVIGIFSILNIWKHKEAAKGMTLPKNQIFKGVIIGVIIGVTTTLTGLGGGVILIPLLMIFYGKNYQDSMPLSLAIIFFISLSSLLFQFQFIASQVTVKEILFLSLGTLIAFIFLANIIKYVQKNQLIKMRKIVFTLLTLAAVGKIAFNVIFPSEENFPVNLDQLYQRALTDEVVIIDVREKNEIQQGMIKHAKWFPLSKMKEDKNWSQEFIQLVNQKEIYLYCRSGRRSGEVQQRLNQKGIKSVNIGGFLQLQHQLPTD